MTNLVLACTRDILDIVHIAYQQICLIAKMSNPVYDLLWQLLTICNGSQRYIIYFPSKEWSIFDEKPVLTTSKSLIKQEQADEALKKNTLPI